MPVFTVNFRRPAAREIDRAALPGGGLEFRHRRAYPRVAIRVQQHHAANTPSRQLVQEVASYVLGVRRSDIQCQHLKPTVAVDAYRDDNRNRQDSPVTRNLRAVVSAGE